MTAEERDPLAKLRQQFDERLASGEDGYPEVSLSYMQIETQLKVEIQTISGNSAELRSQHKVLFGLMALSFVVAIAAAGVGVALLYAGSATAAGVSVAGSVTCGGVGAMLARKDRELRDRTEDCSTRAAASRDLLTRFWVAETIQDASERDAAKRDLLKWPRI